MIATTVNELCAAVGGTVLQGTDAAVTTVCTDSRRVPREALFIPLVVERFDGHAYIEKALEAGAAGCLTAKTPEAGQALQGKGPGQIAEALASDRVPPTRWARAAAMNSSRSPSSTAAGLPFSTLVRRSFTIW